MPFFSPNASPPHSKTSKRVHCWRVILFMEISVPVKDKQKMARGDKEWRAEGETKHIPNTFSKLVVWKSPFFNTFENILQKVYAFHAIKIGFYHTFRVVQLPKHRHLHPRDRAQRYPEPEIPTGLVQSTTQSCAKSAAGGHRRYRIT